MFGTIILEAYSKNEAKDIANFIEEICSPCDDYGWASAGLYAFWDIVTFELLYIGLASDLAVRFKQHNGLIACPEESTKKNRIDAYFDKNTKLGYTIFVQSCFCQPTVSRNSSHHEELRNHTSPLRRFAISEGVNNIKAAEGQLLESFNKIHSQYPDWNEMGGNARSRKHATEGNYEQIVKYLTFSPELSPLVSRSSLRELSSNATFEGFENNLQKVREFMLHLGMSYNESIAFVKKNDSYFAMLLEREEFQDYCSKKSSL